MINRTALVLATLLFAFSPSLPAEDKVQTIPDISNLDEIAKNLHLADFSKRKFTNKVKIAILDNGFNGYEAEIGKNLPSGTVYHQGAASDADHRDTSQSSYHGLFLAELMVKLIEAAEKNSGAKVDYELHLFYSFGFTKFADAVSQVVAGNFDVVLYSQVWEYAGNGDGKGWVNGEVDKAVKAGVLWINAAGNFGHLTKIAPVDGKPSGNATWVNFADKPNDGVSVKCQAPPKQQCDLRLILSWNAFKEDANVGTDKDLDLFLYAPDGSVTASSYLDQKIDINPNDPKDANASKLPREIVEVKIDPGTYKARVKVKSDNFKASEDKLRLTASGLGISLDKPSIGETILPPADNPGVIVIGASDDFETSVSKIMHKPDVNLPSQVVLKDASAPYSTSLAAAMAAAVTVLHLATGMEKDRKVAIENLTKISQKPAESYSSSAKPLPPSATADNKTPTTAAPSAAPPIPNHASAKLQPPLPAGQEAPHVASSSVPKKRAAPAYGYPPPPGFEGEQPGYEGGYADAGPPQGPPPAGGQGYYAGGPGGPPPPPQFGYNGPPPPQGFVATRGGGYPPPGAYLQGGPPPPQGYAIRGGGYPPPPQGYPPPGAEYMQDEYPPGMPDIEIELQQRQRQWRPLRAPQPGPPPDFAQPPPMGYGLRPHPQVLPIPGARIPIGYGPPEGYGPPGGGFIGGPNECGDCGCAGGGAGCGGS